MLLHSMYGEASPGVLQRDARREVLLLLRVVEAGHYSRPATTGSSLRAKGFGVHLLRTSFLLFSFILANGFPTSTYLYDFLGSLYHH